MSQVSEPKTFEQLCVRNEVGFVCDEASMVKRSDRETYDGLVFKLTSKCETTLLLLNSHFGNLTHFSLDVLPYASPSLAGRFIRGTSQDTNGHDALAAAWEKCHAKGYHGLQALANIDASFMPNNGCVERFTVAQFVNSIIHGIEAYFMFQKPKETFVVNDLKLWQTFEESDLKKCFIVLGWKLSQEPTQGVVHRSPLAQVNKTVTPPRLENASRAATLIDNIDTNVRLTPISERFAKDGVKRTIEKVEKDITTTRTTVKRGRRSMAPVPGAERAVDSDEEISFKVQPSSVVMPQVTYLPGMSPKKPEPAKVESPKANISSVMDVSTAEDLTFGFEKTPAKTAARKSTARKSLMPEWPEEEKNDILDFFDNINPSQSEQTCIAVTCKYAMMKFDRDLPSKLLYQWIQKKGRQVNKTVTNYTLPEVEQKESMVQFFHSLNPDLSETSRVAFTCKFVKTQFGVDVTSKQFYTWLNEKNKKTPKRR